MMSKIFSSRSNTAFNMFKITLRQNSGILILVSILALLICPGYVMTLINNSDKGVLSSLSSYAYNMDNTSRILTCVTTVLTSLLAILMNAINFSFLYSKKAADVYGSAPLTRNQMFVSRFLAGFTVSVVPMVIIYASAAALLALSNVYGSLRIIVTGFAYNFIITLVCSAISMLFIVTAGTVFDMVLSFGGVSLGSILVGVVIFVLCDEHLEGFSYTGSEVLNILCTISPFVYCGHALREYIFAAPDFTLQNLKFMITALFLAAVFLVVSGILYRHRKGEKAGSSYAYSFVYLVCALIISFVGAFGIGMIFSRGYTNFTFFIFALIGALLVSVVFGLISYRSFKTIKKSLILGGGSYLALIATYVIIVTGAFGYTTRVPSPENIKTATVSTWNSNFDELRPEQIAEFHKAIVERLDENEAVFEDANIESVGVHINYVLKNGKEISRYYNISNELFADDFLKLYRSEEYRNQIKNFIPKGADVDISCRDDVEYAYHSIDFNVSDANRILEAFSEDMKTATRISFVHQDQVKQAKVYCVDWSRFIDANRTEYRSFNLVVEPQYENTKRVLEEMGLDAMLQEAYSQVK